MTIYIDHQFHYETENLVRLFFPNDKLTVTKEMPQEKTLPFISALLSRKDGIAEINVTVETESRFSEGSKSLKSDNEKDIERAIAVCLYEQLVKVTGRYQPWGILTGVRPIKLFRRLAESGGREFAEAYFKNELLVSDEKTRLASVTEGYEKKKYLH